MPAVPQRSRWRVSEIATVGKHYEIPDKLDKAADGQSVKRISVRHRITPVVERRFGLTDKLADRGATTPDDHGYFVVGQPFLLYQMAEERLERVARYCGHHCFG